MVNILPQETDLVMSGFMTLII
ncbi:UNVERIFIED_CONTAM: hypothetical protein NCL1_62081 [Trichonephila clavipes]